MFPNDPAAGLVPEILGVWLSRFNVSHEDLLLEAASLEPQGAQSVQQRLQNRLSEEKASLGLRCLEELCHLIDSLDFDHAEAYCLKCDTHCMISPRRCGYGNRFWIEIAGTTCVAWSQLGGHCLLKLLLPSGCPCESCPRQTLLDRLVCESSLLSASVPASQPESQVQLPSRGNHREVGVDQQI